MPPLGNTPQQGFEPRHIGTSPADQLAMLDTLDVDSLDTLIDTIVPATVRSDLLPDLPAAATEAEALAELRRLADQNTALRSMIGQGYHDTHTPAPILRHIIENPRWYTAYTPYQSEISQGRLEALLNFQTLVADLTALPVANASLLDEGTAAAEAMSLCVAHARGRKRRFLASDRCHPQTLNVLRTRCASMDVELKLVDPHNLAADVLAAAAGILVQRPDTFGRIDCFDDLCKLARDNDCLVVAACDPLSLTLLTPPGDWQGGGADIAIGSAQRLGVPMGFGGPHAAYFATRENFLRKIPGRIVGVSKDARGNRALRLTLQTREQHIRRDKATSNICTAQVLLAVVASMYAVYHGPQGLRQIATHTRSQAERLRSALNEAGVTTANGPIFDTMLATVDNADDSLRRAEEQGILLRRVDDTHVAITTDETTTDEDLGRLLAALGTNTRLPDTPELPAERTSDFLTHEVFNTHHSETRLLRYIDNLERKDLTLAQSMIPLGSCTMKLNAAAELAPISWPQWNGLHPFAPEKHTLGYQQLTEQLEKWLAELTGFAATSLQPNAGSQGEYAGLLAIKAYHADNGQAQRDVVLIPTSAHGTNPASAVIAGLRVVPVACNERGDVDLNDLRDKASLHADHLAALMITYPSTHGVFEPGVAEACATVHEFGGQVYMDGANLNAQVGLCRPGDYGADVVHLNLHKTFCIPHGGGGPGVGPIACASHLQPYLPGDPLDNDGRAVSAANFGSASILVIPWMYLRMMGLDGLRRATAAAILNANYMAKRLADHYPILYTGPSGRVAHEFILDCRPFEKSAGVTVEDIAKRLMDYGFHAPTMSWPVAGTLMVEPTESEDRAELDRFCDAMIQIRHEIDRIAQGELPRNHNPLKNAPHPADAVTANDWQHPYTREEAAYPLPWVRDRKFWPAIARTDNAFGDRNPACTCPSVEELA
ncbi:aminomethyl-transferring glycine dehydrogenase [Mucisphaera calidilacus]|uniref:Glycine dehydrogenase (decarboxylating) n=1 Tax=Mucisphaera calidilacus TaxID=2527982 RepID=A0A518C0T5_9BACT|nr:aminomethyl-transferring glycine dehydrogenase [Mucisphaera calidilacus]QDU72841.1 Glycine dehydrogenase (decarboxylating) [Mucisphaera calidilacus]